jgi:hypothetical protein
MLLGSASAFLNPLIGILFIIPGAIMLPPVSDAIGKKVPIWRPVKIIVVILSIGIGIGAISAVEKKDHEKAFNALPKAKRDSIIAAKNAKARIDEKEESKRDSISAIEYDKKRAKKELENKQTDVELSVRNYLRDNLKDADSYQIVDFSNVYTGIVDGTEYYIIRHKYRAKNGFGAYDISNQVFFVSKEMKVASVQEYQ